MACCTHLLLQEILIHHLREITEMSGVKPAKPELSQAEESVSEQGSLTSAQPFD